MAKSKVKKFVIAFRLTEAENKFLLRVLNKRVKAEKFVGAFTPGRMARKLTLDWATDKLNWTNPVDKQLSPDISEALASAL
jgi:hypothetical protein